MGICVRARARLSVDLSRSRGGGRLLGAPEPGAPLWLDASYHDKCKTDHNRRGCRDAQMPAPSHRSDSTAPCNVVHGVHTLHAWYARFRENPATDARAGSHARVRWR